MNQMPQLIVIGAQELANILASCGAQWIVHPAAINVSTLWDNLDSGALPDKVTGIVFTDGTPGTDDTLLIQTLAEWAPFADTFLIADSVRGAQIASQTAAYMAQTGKGSFPVHLLPINDLNMSIMIMRQIMADKVVWNDSSATTVSQPAVDQPVAAEPVMPAVEIPSFDVPSLQVEQPVMPAVQPPVEQPVYEQPVAAEPVMPAVEIPSFDVPSLQVEQPVMPAAQPPVEQPVYEQPVAAEPVMPAVQPVVEQPVYEQPVAAEPVMPAVQTFSPQYQQHEEILSASTPQEALQDVSSYQQPTVNYEQTGIYGQEVIDALSQKYQKRPDARPGQMTIACMSSKGGSGKSTTAISLAGMIALSSAAAGDPKKVVIVDLDIRDGQIGSLINQYMPTAVSIRVMPKWDAATVTANLVHDKRLNIDALLAPVRPRNADDVGPDFYRQIIQVLQTTHDVVIMDCSVNYLDPLLGTAFALADEILFVTTLATTSVQGMARALTELFADPIEGGLGIPREKVGIVANQVIQNVGMGKDKLLRAALGAPLVGQIPAEYDEVLTQTNSNRMDNLLKHPRLGPAYYKLAKTCLPDWNLAPTTVQAAQVAAPVAKPEPPKKRGLFGGR